jgi:hypothetical protein
LLLLLVDANSSVVVNDFDDVEELFVVAVDVDDAIGVLMEDDPHPLFLPSNFVSKSMNTIVVCSM